MHVNRGVVSFDPPVRGPDREIQKALRWLMTSEDMRKIFMETRQRVRTPKSVIITRILYTNLPDGRQVTRISEKHSI